MKVLLHHWLLVAVSVMVAFVLVGCSSEPAAAPDAPDPLASLDRPDRAAAQAQKICPVSGDALGSMGTPIKVTVEGQDVFLCCEGCKDSLLEDPAKYLAKLDAKPADESATQ